jgi:putative hemolysin
MLVQILIIFILILINGFFAMSEISLASSRRSRLEELLKKGYKNAKLVLLLSDSPNRFLSTVQVGITLIAIMIGVFSGGKLSQTLGMTLHNIGVGEQFAYEISVVLIVIIITFFSIVIGELVPKRIGLSDPEMIAMMIVKPMLGVSRIIKPFIWLLSICTDFLVRLFNIKPKTDAQVTENEIKALLEEGTEVGTIQEIEQDIVERVFHLGDQRIGALMTTRNDIIWLNIEDPVEENIRKITDNTHSIYPVSEKDLDHLLGIIYAKDLLLALINDPSLKLKDHIKPVNLLPNDQNAYQVLEKFKETLIHFGVVVDEFGSVEGVITLNDILDGLVGDITDVEEPEVIQRSENSWLIDGKLAFFEFLHEFEIDNEDFSDAQFHTIGGFVIHQLKAIPTTGATFEWNGYHFEIVDMDGNRIDKILLTRFPQNENE